MNGGVKHNIHKKDSMLFYALASSEFLLLPPEVLVRKWIQVFNPQT